MTSGPYQEQRAPSGRFLPPDPRVREPHRLTPQLALRVAILGAFALLVFGVLFFRLWSLQVLSGDEYLNAAQSNQLRLIRVEAPRGPILDRRGRVVVSNVAGTAVELWVGDMPDEGPSRARAAAGSRARRQADEARSAGRRAPARPAHADRREDRGRRGAGQLPLRASGGVPRHQDRPDLPARLSVLVARSADPRLHGRDLARGAQAASEELPSRRSDREGRYRSRVRLVPSGTSWSRPDPGRLARTPGEPVCPAAGVDSRLRAAPDARHEAPAGGRAGTPVRHRSRPPEPPVGGQRRRDRRSRPARRRRPRARLGADVQAVGLRGANRPEEARSALLRFAGTHSSTARSRVSIRPGRPGSPSPRSQACRSTCSRPTSRIQCTRLRHIRSRQAGLPQLEPVRQPPDDASRGARGVVRHVLLRDREPVLRRRLREPRAHAAVGAPLRLRNDRRGSTSAARRTGSCRRPSGARRRSRATGIVRGTRETRSSSRSARRTCWSRRCRWPRSTRCSRTAEVSSRRTSSRTSSSREPRVRRASCCDGSRPHRLAPPASTPRRCGLFETACTRRRTRPTARLRVSSPTSPSPSRARREPRRRPFSVAGYPVGHLEDQSWWCGWGPSESARLVVCALIENGGHGSSAAAPAALKVFERFFGVEAPQASLVDTD